MNLLRTPLVPAIAIAAGFLRASAQTDPGFDVTAYQAFLESHRDMASFQLLEMHSAGTFAAKAVTSPDALNYFRAIDSCYTLTAYEKSLLSDHGFVVTDRLPVQSYGGAFREIYNHDLPVFVSTDAILHTMHSSYDAILRVAEEKLLIPDLTSMIASLRAQVPAMGSAYAFNADMSARVRDLDVYLTVASVLLGGAVDPCYPEDAAPVGDLLVLIANHAPAWYGIFSSTPRLIDFSQFIIRGHYTQSAALGRYFQAMMWLGRTEIYLLPPESEGPPPDPLSPDIQRQTIIGALLVEDFDRAGMFPKLEEMDSIIRMFVGESDNVTLPQMKAVMEAGGISGAASLLDTTALATFQDTLKVRSFAFQRIISQLLYNTTPFVPNSIKPASALLPFGQRFVVDSYITGNVVYDRISYQGNAVWRALPSPLDVLFALGNDAAAQLLVKELDTYHYATNLAALRYLIDGYDASFWTGSMYNAWLQMIRACNPPADRSSLPPFMVTAAWWQEKMNTQLASWAELRHDNLLYAKQSYTGIPVCSFPFSYVEPLPAFYDAAGTFARVGQQKLLPLLSSIPGTERLPAYFSMLAGVADTLGSIARKEIAGTALSAEEVTFLHQMLFMNSDGCAVLPDGWYYRLFFDFGGFEKTDYIVADVHTCPSDAAGILVGWVYHVGTGPLNMAIVAATTPEAGPTAFIGPVSSFKQYTSSDFVRLTDEQWGTSYASLQSLRPSFVNLYLANNLGESRGEAVSLLTGVQPGAPPSLPRSAELFQNYPNPFNPATRIRYVLPHRTEVTLTVYNTLGQRVATLVRGVQEAGFHDAVFDATGLASGVYYYRLQAGGYVQSKGMLLLK